MELGRSDVVCPNVSFRWANRSLKQVRIVVFKGTLADAQYCDPTEETGHIPACQGIINIWRFAKVLSTVFARSYGRGEGVV